MPSQAEHISICICTYKRQEMLGRLLEALQCQKTENRFTYSIVVVDNDRLLSASDVAEWFRITYPIQLSYLCEPDRNIALARNKAVQAAEGRYVALIDDDEVPEVDWLISLYDAYKRFDADGILGPVVPRFEGDPPRWVVKGRFFEKGGHRTGCLLNWQDTRTSNVLLNRSIFEDPDYLFNKEFGRGGEDMDFFKRAIDGDFRFFWCAEAPVFEIIPRQRCSRTYMVKRAILRGQLTVGYSCFGPRYIVKSLIAVPAYTAALPFALVSGHHRFMTILIKLAEHLGRFLALSRIDLIKEYYVSE
jgi:succinoglycan biosynthesis protein ExoM